MTNGPSWAAVAIAVALSWLTVVALTRYAAVLPQDRPGPRSLHRQPVPRVGGIAIWAGFLPAAAIAAPAVPGAWGLWLVAIVGIAVVSLADDFRGVHPVPRLAAHLFAAIAVAFALVAPGPELTQASRACAVAATAVTLVWAANLFNFMDGNDGLAATMACCGFGVYGIAAWQAGTPAAAYFALAAATLPFLAVNMPPARMFMGDVGSVPLGFLAGALGLAGWQTGTWPAWFPLLVFLPFIADATATLAKRLLRLVRIWESHQVQFYQRLHRLGAGHRGTLLVFGVLMAGTGTSALATLALAPAFGWGVTAAWSVLMAMFFFRIDYHWRHRKPVHR